MLKRTTKARASSAQGHETVNPVTGLIWRGERHVIGGLLGICCDGEERREDSTGGQRASATVAASATDATEGKEDHSDVQTSYV